MNTYTATCPEELTPLVSEELGLLGAKNVQNQYKAVQFEANLATAYRIHLQLRTASRIFKELFSFPPSHPDQLRSHVQKKDWSSIFTAEATFKIEVTNTWQEDRTPPFLYEKVVREGIQEFFRRQSIQPPRVDIKNPNLKIHLFLHKKTFTLLVDTTGKSLHKRGYRGSGHPAPLKETLAAAMLQFAGYKGQAPFLDPMCGSGTLAIEAASVAMDKAPLIHRKKGQFGLEWTKDFDKNLWKQVCEEARKQKIQAPKFPIIASDIAEKYANLCQENALRARVEKHLTISTASAFDQLPTSPAGFLVTNLPYGARLNTPAELLQLYSDFGNHLKRNFAGWTAAILVAADSPHKKIGLRPDKKIPILNGDIPCKILLFQLYEGSRKKSKQCQQPSVISKQLESENSLDGSYSKGIFAAEVRT